MPEVVFFREADGRVHGREVVVVSHGFVKAGAAVPRREIDRAIRRRWRFVSDPASHRCRAEA